MLDRGILTLSLAPRDNHEAQVQFALERGIPAILGIISTQRLPFPSNAFDMAHCSRCLIPWTEFGTFLKIYHMINVIIDVAKLAGQKGHVWWVELNSTCAYDNGSKCVIFLVLVESCWVSLALKFL